MGTCSVTSWAASPFFVGRKAQGAIPKLELRTPENDLHLGEPVLVPGQLIKIHAGRCLAETCFLVGAANAESWQTISCQKSIVVGTRSNCLPHSVRVGRNV